MNRNLLKSLSVMVLVIGLLTGCQTQAQEEKEVKGKPVKVEEAKLVEKSLELKYKGTVVPKDQIKYGFKSTGKLKSLNVKAGDKVKKGQVLASLDSIDLNLQLSKANSALNASNADINKAKIALDYDENQYNNMKKLYDDGGISKDQLDQVKLKYEASKNSYNQANEAYDISKTNYNLQKRLVDDSYIIAKTDGVILSTVFEEGELVPQGNPVVVLRNNSKIIQVGLSESDIDKVNMNTNAIIEYDDTKIKGKVVELNDVPDMQTRTYLVKIESENQDIRIGKILDVKLEVGKEDGVWIPIDSVLSQGEQFVYVVEEDRAFKRVVTIDDIKEFDVKVKGLNEGERFVTLGMKKLNDGAKIQIIEEIALENEDSKVR
ncbi:MAG: efflux RND transporter periplasmic adaptor subunit [Peptostreptococcaceae bacterium]|nr:efflux RND transporter periplasmic adaptor subunit [Peptostreptococcaceae bacterium]